MTALQQLGAANICFLRGLPSKAPFWAALALLLALAGCGGDAKPSTPLAPDLTATQPPFATPAPPTPLATPTLGTVIWTTAVDPTTGAPADAVTAYAPDAPRLIAALPATALPVGATVDAAWFYNDTTLDAFTTRLTLPDRATKRWVDLQLSRQSDAPWPTGTYEVVISLDGAEVQRAAVLVVGDTG